ISVTFAGFALIALILRPPRVACMFKKTLLVPLRKGRVLHNVYQNQGICKLLIPNDMKLCRCILYIGERKVRGFSPVLLKMSRGKLGRKAVMNYHSQLASDLQIEPLFRRQHGTSSMEGRGCRGRNSHPESGIQSGPATNRTPAGLDRKRRRGPGSHERQYRYEKHQHIDGNRSRSEDAQRASRERPLPARRERERVD